MKKTIAFFLMIFLLLSVFASCRSDKPGAVATSGNGSTQNPNGSETNAASVTDENGYLLDSLGTMDFGEQVIHISAWSELNTQIKEFNPGATEDNVVSRAIYERNVAVEDRLNVRLNYDLREGWLAENHTEQLAFIRAAQGSRDVDIVATYSWATGTLTMEGLLTDLTKVAHLDFSAPWWESRMLETNSAYGSLYFITGDIAPSLIGQTYCILFNKSIVNSADGMPDLYQLVRDKKWTLDEMITLSEMVANDLGEVGKEVTDRYGFAANMTSTDVFYMASGLKIIEKGDDGSVVLSEDYGSEKTDTLVNKLASFFQSPAAYINDGSYSSVWRRNNSLFVLDLFVNVKSHVLSGMTDFGVLPVPMYNEAQGEYYTTPGFYYTMYGITTAAKNDPAVGATLEAMASEGYRRITPVFYNDTIQLQSSQTNDEYEMWDYIRSGLVIESGRVFSRQFSWDKGTWWPFRNAVNNGVSWSGNWYPSIVEHVNSKIAVINETLARWTSKEI